MCTGGGVSSFVCNGGGGCCVYGEGGCLVCIWRRGGVVICERCFGPVCIMVGKTWLAYSHHCASIQTQVLENFSCRHRPPNQWVPGAISKFPRSTPLWGRTGEDLPISTTGRA